MAPCATVFIPLEVDINSIINVENVGMATDNIEWRFVRSNLLLKNGTLSRSNHIVTDLESLCISNICSILLNSVQKETRYHQKNFRCLEKLVEHKNTKNDDMST